MNQLSLTMMKSEKPVPRTMEGKFSHLSQKRNINAVKQEKKKLKKMKTQVAATKKVIASGDVDVADDATTSNTNKHDNAGDAFGGKRTKAKEKE